MPVSLPPLRERQADIPLLVDHFLEIFAGQFGKTFSAVSGEVMDLFMSYDWHGNIRELRHTLEHACILSPGGEVQLRHMRRDFVDQMLGSQSAAPIFAGTADAPPAAFPRKAGRQEILAELDRCSGNKARAARRLGIHRATLYRKLKAWGLED
jgi:DNA-binding NtrC family response regulator